MFKCMDNGVIQFGWRSPSENNINNAKCEP